MKKDYKNKVLHSEQVKQEEAPAVVCRRECVVPGFGHFLHGQVVTDPRLVEKFWNHPNFVNQQEDK